jgi:APA family basic amino acid/polyamine antiporter
MADEAPAKPQLVRGLGAWDATLITIGSILGTGIFITTGDMARVLPHPGLILAAWLVGGLLTLTGALTYAELGGMFPEAGGQYHFLKEAYGPIWGFLFGWAAFTVINSGGIATIAVGFGEYLGSFVPFFSTQNELIAIAGRAITGGQLAGALAIVLLTAVNYVGLREGAGVQNFVTVVKVAAIVGLGVIGLLVPAPVSVTLFAPLPHGNALAAFGVAMIAVLWSFDGWYAVTNMAGEMRKPQRQLPLGLIAGTAAVTLLYLLMNLVYVRALPVEAMAGAPRIGEAAAQALLGPLGGKLISAAVLISAFGCISSTILFAARIYQPMAQDGVFFPALARIHPRHRTPAASIVAQGIWSTLLTFSGSYEQLYTYVMFAMVLFHAATGAAVIVLRFTRPDAQRPYRAWGYPLVPLVFTLSSLAIVANTLIEKPKESFIGLFILALGLPAYFRWRRRAAARGSA